MPSDFDASIKLLYPVDVKTFFTIDDVANGASFDVIANVEIGRDLNQNVDRYELRIGVVNVTQSQSVAIVNSSGGLTPSDQPFLFEHRVNIPAGWSAQVGDVLQAVASYRVVAGANVDFSTASSLTFVVS